MSKMELLDRGQLESAWPGRASQAPRASFSEGDVPDNLRPLIPYAEIWGIEDDLERQQVTDSTPPELADHVARIVRSYHEELNDWLAGDESWSDKPSDAYVAFSVLRMTSDLLAAHRK